MVIKKKVKKPSIKKIEPMYIPEIRQDRRILIYFKRPCKRCEMIFTPDSKTGKICPNCIITKKNPNAVKLKRLPFNDKL
jgi:hypothetical protein